MLFFLVIGFVGLLLLVLSYVLEGLFEAADGTGAELLGGALSVPVLAAFVSMLGFAGAIVTAATPLGTGPATLVGAVAGLGAGWLAWRLNRALSQGQTSAAPSDVELVGSAGTMVTPVTTAGGYGEVLVRVAGQRIKYTARSSQPVQLGARVEVAAVLSATAVEVHPG